MAAFEAEERAAWQAVDNIGAEAREENACGARRLFAIGQLYDVRAPDDDTEKLCWAIDGHSSLVAEVAVALALSRCRAAAQVRMAIALYTRLPRVLATAKSGLVDYRMLAAIVSRTELIQDPATSYLESSSTRSTTYAASPTTPCKPPSRTTNSASTA